MEIKQSIDPPKIYSCK